MVEWLISQQPKIAKATWRQYRASVIYYLQQQKASEDINGAITALETIDSNACCKRGMVTSANKQKKINDADLARLIEYATNKSTKYGASAVLWLLAGLYAGLRPGEWQHAYINEDNQLIVKNAKATNGRSHGQIRKIDLAPLADKDRQVLERHLFLIKQVNGKGGFKPYYDHCRSALYELTRSLWPKRKQHITLYSARHQFAANAKRSGLSLEEVAALMGHASTETAAQHYGRKVSGKTNGIGVKASAEDVERVILLNQHRNEKSLSHDL